MVGNMTMIDIKMKMNPMLKEVVFFIFFLLMKFVSDDPWKIA